jgi:hypothetical protein
MTSVATRLASEVDRLTAANGRWQKYAAEQTNRASNLRAELQHIVTAADEVADDLSRAGAEQQATILRGFADRAQKALNEGNQQ